MTTTFLLVRHGSHDSVGQVLVGRTPGIGLSRRGRSEAENLSCRLARDPVTALYSSPSQRARETAEILADRCGTGVTVRPELDEVDFGEWTNRSFDELEQDPSWAVWNSRRSEAAAPGGEAMRAVQGRVVGCMEEIAARHPGGTAVIVGHCDPIRAALLHHLDMPLDFIERLEVAPGSLSTIAVGAWGARLIGLNEVPAA